MNSKNREQQTSVTVSSTKTSSGQPRFWQSKASGWNLRLHPRGIKNNWVTPSVGDTHFYTRLHRTYVDDRRPRQVRLQAAYKDFYQIQGRITYKKHNPTVLERRVDVLLHRSGLVNSIAQGRQWVSHGHIYSILNGTKRILKNPSYKAQVGEIIGINSNIWISSANSDSSDNSATTSSNFGGQRKNSANHFKGFIRKVDKTNTSQKDNVDVSPETTDMEVESDRTIPPYLEVDYINGSLVLVNKPVMNQIIIPAGLLDTVKLW